MGIRKDTTSLDAAYGITLEPVQATHQMRGDVSPAFGNVSITTEAVIRAANAKRLSLIVQNLGAGDLYVGTAGVTTSTGMKVASGGSITIDWTTAAIKGVSSGTSDVRFWEETLS